MDDNSKTEVIDKDFAPYQSPHEASVDRLIKSIDRAYHHPWLMAWRSFWYGVATAIGLSVGYAIVIFILVRVYNNYGGVEIFRTPLSKIQQMVIPKQLQNALDNSQQTNTTQN